MRYAYALKQGGLIVAMAEAPTDEQARREINHYAIVYGQDGPVEIVNLAEDEFADFEVIDGPAW